MNILENQQLAEPVDAIYIDLEAQILQNIARHLQGWEQPIDTDRWLMQKLAEIGKLNQENIRLIAKMSGLSQTAAERMLNAAAEDAVRNLDPGLRYLAERGLAETAVKANKSKNVKQVVRDFRKQAKDTLNMCNTNMLYKASEKYKGLVGNIAQEAWNILNSGAAGVMSGVEARQQAVRRCIRQLNDKGIPAFVDKRGREWTPEAYVNMAMRNTAKSTAEEVQDARIRDAGCHLIQIDSHSGARPKCAKDQGKIFDLNNGSGYTEDLYGKKIRYYPWNSSSYGEPDGILGINCRHHKWPFVPGVNVQRHFPTEDMDANDKLYKQTQVQRALEREVRKQKRECMMLEAAGDQEGFEEASVKLKHTENKLKYYVKDTPGLHRRTDREQIVGFDKRISTETIAKTKGIKKKDQVHISEKAQMYRPVTRGERSVIEIKHGKSVAANRVTSYSGEVFVSEAAKIKPKALHIINKNTEDALKKWDIPLERKPKIVVASLDELNAYGKYDAVTNTVYYIPQIVNKAKMASGDVEFHEMWHMKQAEDSRKAGWKITESNRGEYLKELCKRAKKNLDGLGITSDNVNKISQYAYEQYQLGRYDETEAEFMSIYRRQK